MIPLTLAKKIDAQIVTNAESLLRDPLQPKAYGAITVKVTQARFTQDVEDHIRQLGYTRQFVIYDETDRTSLVKTCLRDLNIDDSVYQPRAVIARISALKNNLVDAEQYGRTSASFGFDDAVYRTYSLYQERIRESNGMDFDDLLMQTVLLFERNQDVLGHYQGLFQHVLVDEYQDTNLLQEQLYFELAAACVVEQAKLNLSRVGGEQRKIYAEATPRRAARVG